jgi:hypothetical protein
MSGLRNIYSNFNSIGLNSLNSVEICWIGNNYRAKTPHDTAYNKGLFLKFSRLCSSKPGAGGADLIILHSPSKPHSISRCQRTSRPQNLGRVHIVTGKVTPPEKNELCISILTRVLIKNGPGEILRHMTHSPEVRQQFEMLWANRKPMDEIASTLSNVPLSTLKKWAKRVKTSRALEIARTARKTK